MEQIELQSSKIKCGGCVANIEKGLSEIEGVTEVTVELESNIVNVQGSELNKEVLKNKLAELGYPVI